MLIVDENLLLLLIEVLADPFIGGGVGEILRISFHSHSVVLYY